LQQLAHLVQVLEKASDAHDCDLIKMVQSALFAVNSNVADDCVYVSSQVSLILETWHNVLATQTSETDQTAHLRLAAIAKTLEVCMKVVPTQTRYVKVSEHALTVPLTTSSNIVKLVCAETAAQVLDIVMAEFAHRGVLPERQCLLLCSPATTVDELRRFVLRWSGACMHSRKSMLYCIASVEKLSFELQRRLTIFIRDETVRASNILLLVAGQTENQHIVAHFASKRTAPVCISDKAKEDIGLALTRYSQGASLHVSTFAGAGKSFAIRSRAYANGATYVPINVNSSITQQLLIDRIKAQLSLSSQVLEHESKVLLHFDLTDPIREDFNSVLFEVLFFGGLISGRNSWFWSPNRTMIAVELSCGPLSERLRSTSFLLKEVAEVTSTSFQTTKDALRVGMGVEFVSLRNDGTLSTMQPHPSDAYQRLQYVCAALALLARGAFPFDFQGPSSTTLSSVSDESQIASTARTATAKDFYPDVEPDECLRLLQKYSNLGQNPSLWCIWNFINVMYWQLKDMHHPESPLNCACMPDISAANASSRDSDSKQKIKCEIVAFMTRTAKEFATRQVKDVATEDFVACHISSFSRAEFNGIWNRKPFDNDGHHCFQSGLFYLYFRACKLICFLHFNILPL
jgi:hypothetical protein